MAKKVAVLLAGCGYLDGAEVNEVILTLLSLEQHSFEYDCFAPDISQYHVINHVTGEEMPETRNVLVEASRLVRGNCKPISELDTNQYDGLVIPGGFGVAKNLSDLAIVGGDFQIQEDVLRVCLGFKESEKPAAYMCIAPVLLSKLYPGINCTIGNEESFASIIESHGGKHTVASVSDAIVDASNKVVSTPAYMLAESVSDAYAGISCLVAKYSELF